jgi:hypothetical protein
MIVKSIQVRYLADCTKVTKCHINKRKCELKGKHGEIYCVEVRRSIHKTYSVIFALKLIMGKCK